VKKQFKDALHRYKVEAFKTAHNNCNVDEQGFAKEILGGTEEALQNAYHFHFHKDPSPHRVETYNMIRNFVLEAILPPVMDKVMRRIVVLEKQHTQLVRLLDDVLELLSEDEAETSRRSARG
jgi:hypothetical protein